MSMVAKTWILYKKQTRYITHCLLDVFLGIRSGKASSLDKVATFISSFAVDGEAGNVGSNGFLRFWHCFCMNMSL